MSMNGDGSGKAAAINVGWPNVLGYRKHDGSRWRLGEDYDFDGVTDPSGIPPVELVAVNESNIWVQLTGDPDVHWTGLDRPSWAKDDSFVSFQGVMNTGSEVVGGLFVVLIDWSTGSPVAAPPILAVETEVNVSDLYWWYSGVNLYSHDWSPDASKVVFENYDANGFLGLSIAHYCFGS